MLVTLFNLSLAICKVQWLNCSDYLLATTANSMFKPIETRPHRAIPDWEQPVGICPSLIKVLVPRSDIIKGRFVSLGTFVSGKFIDVLKLGTIVWKYGKVTAYLGLFRDIFMGPLTLLSYLQEPYCVEWSVLSKVGCFQNELAKPGSQESLDWGASSVNVKPSEGSAERELE